MAHILVIEDDESFRTVLVKHLEREGYFVSQADNGREGLYLLRRNPADLVITDIFMPEADGLEVIMEVRKKQKRGCSRIPVIAVSGGMVTSPAKKVCFLKQAGQFGADRIFPKPFDFRELLNTVQELLTGGAVA
jgi:DNA-binding response OmpR family regulator